MPARRSGNFPPLVGSWIADYHVKIVATLSPDQADLLVGIPPRDGDIWHTWYGFEPRDLVVVIDYPLDEPVKRLIPTERYVHPSGIASFGRFLLAVAEEYMEIYRNPEKYGVFGHGMGDLYFEKVTVRKDGTVELSIGS